MANNTANVTYGKPKVGGAIFTAPLGTTLPADATTELDAAYKCLGYASEDGVVNGMAIESESIKAWGGDTVLVIQTSKEETLGYTLIETLSVDVLKEVYGQTNVAGTLETGITIKNNTKPLEEHVIVIDMILKGDVLKRIVIPQANVTEIGEIVYKDTEATGFETTLTAIPDTEGNTSYQYIIKKATTTEPETP